MPSNKAHSFVGGRGRRYDPSRHATHHAPPWTGRAASAARKVLNLVRDGRPELAFTADILVDSQAWAELRSLLSHALSAGDFKVASDVIEHHRERLSRPPGGQPHSPELLLATKGILRTWNRQVRPVRAVTLLVSPGRRSSSVRSDDDGAETVADFFKGPGCPAPARATETIRRRLAAWGLDGASGVIVPERAAARVRHEREARGLAIDATFARGLLHDESLPTLTGNPADGYFDVRSCRWWTTYEIALSCGVPPQSGLWRALMPASALTPQQQIAALGRSVHVIAAAAALGPLLTHVAGAGVRAMRYGSAFSGVDTVAAAIECLPGIRVGDDAAQSAMAGMSWEYVFAAESGAAQSALREALVEAWGCNGLVSERVYHDARRLVEDGAPPVDLLSVTPECVAFSRRNHSKSVEAQAAALVAVHDTFQYVRRHRPLAVLVENVDEREAVDAISAVVGAVEGYRWERIVICPTMLGWPVHRRRSFWRGYRVE